MRLKQRERVRINEGIRYQLTNWSFHSVKPAFRLGTEKNLQLQTLDSCASARLKPSVRWAPSVPSAVTSALFVDKHFFLLLVKKTRFDFSSLSFISHKEKVWLAQQSRCKRGFSLQVKMNINDDKNVFKEHKKAAYISSYTIYEDGELDFIICSENTSTLPWQVWSNNERDWNYIIYWYGHNINYFIIIIISYIYYNYNCNSILICSHLYDES